MKKLIKESLYEKFEEHSDPIKDMKIGFNRNRYLTEKLKRYNIEVDTYYEGFAYLIQELYNREGVNNLVNTILDNTPAEYQKQFIDEYVYSFLEGEDLEILPEDEI